jgi:Calcineurin-like phosphoesterase
MNSRGCRTTLAFVAAACAVATAQQQAPPPPSWMAVKPIEPPATPLPPEEASAGVTRFSFLAYGDTRTGAGTPNDADAPNPEHALVMDGMLAKVRALASTPLPVRLVLLSGDAVLRGIDSARWNNGFTPLIERLTKGANIPYFLSAGNHDVTSAPAGDPQRAIGLHNTLTAISRLIPPEGSPRRLNGYPTYAIAYGNAFFIALDSQIAGDTIQASWVANQLERLDRARYRHVVVFFHHPPFSSGPHSGASGDPVPGTGVKAPDRVEAQTTAIRTLYMPLFRKHRVRLVVTGHDHLYDHFVERYDDQGVTYRMDTIVTGGGGAPTYTYAGEPDLRAYLRDGAAANVRVEQLMKPGMTIAENPHHFVVIQIDGDKLSLEVVGTGAAPYTPYPGGVSRISLEDVRPSSGLPPRSAPGA